MAVSNVTFKDNRVEVKNALNQKAIKFLIEAGSSIIQQTQRNTPRASSQLANSFDWNTEPDGDSYIDEGELVAYVGSSLKHALYMEMGTGEYAVEGGRKGGWWIKVGSGEGEIPLEIASKYGWKKVRKDKNGNLTFVFTDGTKPRRMLYKAFQSKKSKIEKQAEMVYKELN